MWRRSCSSHMHVQSLERRKGPHCTHLSRLLGNQWQRRFVVIQLEAKWAAWNLERLKSSLFRSVATILSLSYIYQVSSWSAWEGKGEENRSIFRRVMCLWNSGILNSIITSELSMTIGSAFGFDWIQLESTIRKGPNRINRSIVWRWKHLEESNGEEGSGVFVLIPISLPKVSQKVSQKDESIHTTSLMGMKGKIVG